MAQGPRFKEQTIRRLRDIFDARHKSVAAIEKEMGKSRGYLGDAFRSEKRLSFETILEILDHLEIDPAAFFRGPTEEERRRLAYPGVDDPAPGVAEPGPVESDLGIGTRRTMMALIRVLESKGLVDREELQAALAEPERG